MNNNNDFIELFERRLCDYTGAPHAIAVDRCTNAILLCVEYLARMRIISKSRILTIPARTYISVPMTLMNYGYDIKLTDEQWSGYYQIGDTTVYDYAVGFEWGMYVPGQIQCLSFQQKKRLPIGKGGAILTDDASMATTLRRMRHDGRDSAVTTAADIPNIIHGYHMYMSPDEAAKGILLINQQLPMFVPGSCHDYPDARSIECLRGCQ